MSGRVRIASHDEPDARRLLEPLAPYLAEMGTSWEWESSRRSVFGRGRSRWVVGPGVQGPRALTILPAGADPRAENRPRSDKSPRLATESLGSALEGFDAILPRLVPDLCYPGSTGSDVFQVTRRFHLEDRPRIVYLGGYDNGAVMSRMFDLAKRLVRGAGEWILPDSADKRANLAPVLAHLRLAERVVFLPALAAEEMAGLLLGADVAVALDPDWTWPGLGSWAMASGTPVVAQHSPLTEAVFGPSALFVYEDGLEIWEKALRLALTDEGVREELTRRALGLSEGWRVSRSAPTWIGTLSRFLR